MLGLQLRCSEVKHQNKVPPNFRDAKARLAAPKSLTRGFKRVHFASPANGAFVCISCLAEVKAKSPRASTRLSFGLSKVDGWLVKENDKAATARKTLEKPQRT
ncbi:hypothetical protein P7K49_021004 [Saguinus oedipus]|uniref:Uncharacterized protein n=1 Tax=Saguinus oedipus TaxID=9490 RepID=A0ABQ9URE9_SAGOE|nr:hypothetical protein P7K49_021004 [Saguinus oedipus]